MKQWFVLATWLFFTLVIASSQNYPTVRFTTHLYTTGSYQNFITSLRNNLRSVTQSHGIPVLRKPSQVTSQNKFLLVELINYDSKRSITLALYVVDVYVIGYKSEGNSFFLKDSPKGSEDLLFAGKEKVRLQLDSTYAKLGDRSKIPLGIGALATAIDTLHNFDGRNVNDAFRHSLVVVAEMVAEATRFKFIEEYIKNNLEYGYTPKGDTISYENQWNSLSEQIQKSGSDGKFKTKVRVQNEDYSIKYVSSVAEVKPDIAMLLYKGTGETLGEAISDEEGLQVL
ncbi:ribosome-inactivating protein cucurmosin-like [Euphorbia lathyris]|uniref:ribosome-inactivating protein cucurmosin-like n=1 Tax=Euphorbia lathyris TaxID=212925 RepID=UPI00331351C3